MCAAQQYVIENRIHTSIQGFSCSHGSSTHIQIHNYTHNQTSKAMTVVLMP